MFDTIDFVLDEHPDAPVSGSLIAAPDDGALLDAYSQAITDVVDRVGPGGIFGEMALIDQSPRAANAVAETDCALLAINRNVFLNLVKSEPRFGIALLSATAERLRNTAAALN